MIPVDPVNLFDPSPFGPVSYYGHIAIAMLVVRAAPPLMVAEFYQYLSIPVGVILFAPLVIAPLMIWLFFASCLPFLTNQRLLYDSIAFDLRAATYTIVL